MQVLMNKRGKTREAESQDVMECIGGREGHVCARLRIFNVKILRRWRVDRTRAGVEYPDLPRGGAKIDAPKIKEGPRASVQDVKHRIGSICGGRVSGQLANSHLVRKPTTMMTCKSIQSEGGIVRSLDAVSGDDATGTRQRVLCGISLKLQLPNAMGTARMERPQSRDLVRYSALFALRAQSTQPVRVLAKIGSA